MKCDRCGERIPAGEEVVYGGKTLCEVCYMHTLSPLRACDPWAVRGAQTLSKLGQSYTSLSEMQENILKVLRETGGITAELLAQRVALSKYELERQLATLRHMEKIRGKMQDGVKIVCLWED